MASSHFSPSSASKRPQPEKEQQQQEEEDSSVTILVNDKRELFYDQETMQKVLDSNREETQVTFVHVSPPPPPGSSGESTAEQQQQDFVETLDVSGNSESGERVIDADPTLESLIEDDPSSAIIVNPNILDQDQFSRLENVLQSVEAKEMLMNIDFEPGIEDEVTKEEIREEQQQQQQQQQQQSPPKRRSQRQIDKDLKEEAERIRLENQALMMKEKEAMNKTPAATNSGGGRPKRERKVPAHLKSGDFETSISISAAKKKSSSASAAVSMTATSATSSSSKDDEADVESEAKKEDEESEEESGDDWNSEDDPDRLWCVCKQPHNNRFMICCDTCLDWYHGKCVGITKAKGKEMEEAEKAWKCPKCVDTQTSAKNEKQKAELALKLKEREKFRSQMMEKRKQKAMKKLSSQTSASSTSSTANEKRGGEKEKKKKSCHICEKVPMADSIFCSDDCIVAHAKKATGALKANNPSMSSHSPVIVIDPTKNSTMLTGPAAPTLSNLQSWLLTHPTFHVVTPRGIPTSKFYQKKKQQSPHKTTKLITPPKPDPEDREKVNRELAKYKKESLESLSAARQELIMRESSNKQLQRRKSSHDAASSSSGRKSSSHHHQPSPPQQLKRSTSTSTTTGSTPKAESPVVKNPPADSKTIRHNCCKGLQEALKKRLEDAKEMAKIEDKKLKSLAHEIEDELYRLFNKDVGHKYKAKYRSLLFNIKDAKNQGLFRQIVSGKIRPRKLVAMSADELASRELKQWREQELKAAVEKIKSYELDELARGTKVVLKSHKGEQEIEEKPAVNEFKLPDEMKDEEDEDGFKWNSKSWDHGKHGVESQCDVCSGKKTEKEFNEAKEKRRKDRHHHHHHHHHHHRRHSSSSSKHKHHKKDADDKSSRSSSSASSSSSHKKHKHHRDKDRKHRHEDSKKKKKEHGDKKGEKEEEKAEKVLEKQEDEEQKRKALEEKMANAQKVFSEIQKSIDESKDHEAEEEDDDDVVVRDEEEEKKREDVNEPREGDQDDNNDGIKTPPLPPPSDSPQVSSTVQIKTPDTPAFDMTAKGSDPAVWQGSVDMPDVAKFSVTAHAVSGTTDYLTVDLRNPLKIVGRISPNIVWGYLAQVKELKEVLVIRLQPTSEEEKVKYDEFYLYLSKRGRFGVVGENGKMVKDCYILPLASGEKLHPHLRPVDGPGLDETRKTDVLLALIVRSKRKRTYKEVQKVAVEDEYDPATAQVESEDDDEEEVYDPESAFADESSAKKQKLEPEFSDEEEPAKKKDSKKFQELAKLSKQVEEKRAEVERMKRTDPRRQPQQASSATTTGAVAGFQGLPSGIADLLFGSGSAKASATPDDKKSLSAMSDADLLVKVQEMEGQKQQQQQQQQQQSQPEGIFGVTPVQTASWLQQPPPGPQPHADYPPQQHHQAPPPGPPGPPGPWMQGYEPNPAWDHNQQFQRHPHPQDRGFGGGGGRGGGNDRWQDRRGGGGGNWKSGGGRRWNDRGGDRHHGRDRRRDRNKRRSRSRSPRRN